ncbi:MAG: hypothetical protein AAFS01_05490 [Pseudomonadota bacterium]
MKSPSEAGEMVGKSKSAILRAIKKGTLSASKDEAGNYQIDPSELSRVYKILPEAQRGAPPSPAKAKQPNPPGLHTQLKAIEEKLAMLKEEREREQRTAQDTIDDLRTRLDRESEERTRLTARLLTDDRPHEKRGLFGLGKRRAER